MSTAHRPGRRLPIPPAWPVRSSPAAHPWAIISAGLAPILLTGAYLMAGTLQPASYSPVRSTISVMAGQAGTDRWVVTGGIVLTGGCYLVTAMGLTGVRASARALLIVAGMAGIGIAASPEPARGTTPAAPGLDRARRGHDHCVARLRRPARLTAGGRPACDRHGSGTPGRDGLPAAARGGRAGHRRRRLPRVCPGAPGHPRGGC